MCSVKELQLLADLALDPLQCISPRLPCSTKCNVRFGNPNTVVYANRETAITLHLDSTV